MSAAHTPGPWRIMACPDLAGKHPFHDHRWIATADAEVEYDCNPANWRLPSGSLICEMRDGPTANAHLIAAAPEMLYALKRIVEEYVKRSETGVPEDGEMWWALRHARAAIAKAEGAQ